MYFLDAHIAYLDSESSVHLGLGRRRLLQKRRTDGVVGVDDGDNVERHELVDRGEKLPTRLLRVKVRPRYKHLKRLCTLVMSGKMLNKKNGTVWLG